MLFTKTTRLSPGSRALGRGSTGHHGYSRGGHRFPRTPVCRPSHAIQRHSPQWRQEARDQTADEVPCALRESGVRGRLQAIDDRENLIHPVVRDEVDRNARDACFRIWDLQFERERLVDGNAMEQQPDGLRSGQAHRRERFRRLLRKGWGWTMSPWSAPPRRQPARRRRRAARACRSSCRRLRESSANGRRDRAPALGERPPEWSRHRTS